MKIVLLDMQINQKSFFTFTLKSKTGNVVVNPDSSSIKDSIIVYSVNDNDLIKQNTDESNLVINASGEYESKDIFINSVKLKDQDIFVHVVAVEDIRVGVVSFIKDTKLIPEDFLESIDVLLIGASGGDTFLNVEEAVMYAQKVAPKIAIFHGFKEQVAKENSLNLASVEELKKHLPALITSEKSLKLTFDEVSDMTDTVFYSFDQE